MHLVVRINQVATRQLVVVEYHLPQCLDPCSFDLPADSFAAATSSTWNSVATVADCACLYLVANIG